MTGKTNTNRVLGFLGYGACFGAGAIWGLGFYFGRLALNEMSVEYMVLYRFLFGSLGMLPIAVAHRHSFRLTASELRTMLVCAFLGVPVQFLLQFQGLARTTVSHAAMMVGSLPVMLAATAAIFAGERLDRMGWTALWASTLGASLIALGGIRFQATPGQPSLIGDLLVVASLVTSLVWIMLSKKLMFTHHPAVVSAYTIFSGTAMLAIWVLGQWALSPLTHANAAPPSFARVSSTAWIALALSGLLCTATTTFLWNWGIHYVPTSRAGIFINLEPVVGSWLGVQLLGEHLGPYALTGGGLILISAVVLTVRGQPVSPAVLLE
jgi:drug/metabolite transporter (DMT)-like permease